MANKVDNSHPEPKQLSDLLELEKLYLSRTINLKDGTYGFLFTKSGGSVNSEPSYQCHPCGISLSGRHEFLQHVDDSKHTSTMEKGCFDRDSFTRVLEFQQEGTYVVPGEPAPPGLEDIVEVPCEIQERLDEHEAPALIGLEYLVEIVNEFELEDPTAPKVKVSYLCLLCDKKGTPFNILTHVGSPNHCLNYLKLYFPNIFLPVDKFPKVVENKEGVNSIVKRIAAKIEKKYGRMRPRVVSYSQIMSSDGKLAVVNDINAGPHFKEQPEDVEEWKKFINFKYVLRPEQLPLDYPPSPPPKRTKKKAVSPPSFYANKKNTGNKFYRKHNALSEIETVHENTDRIKGRGERRNRRNSVSPVAGSRLGLRDTSPISIGSSHSRSPDRRPKPPRRTSPSSGRYPPSRLRRISPRRNPRDYHSSRRSRSLERRNGRPRRSRSRSRSRRHSPPERQLPYRRPNISRSRSRSPHGRVPSAIMNERRKLGRELDDSYRSSRIHISSERHLEDERRRIEKLKFEEFKEELARLEIDLLDRLKYHEKNPEKHPLYPEEWKLFWNKRYKELVAEGKDANKYDFKPEWISFWDKRMKELHDSELLEKKKALKERLGITSELLRSKSPVSDLKHTWHALTGSSIRDVRSRSPRHDRSSRSRRSHRSPSPRREREGSRRSRSRSRSVEEIIQLPEQEFPPHIMIPGMFPPRFLAPGMFPGIPRFMPRMHPFLHMGEIPPRISQLPPPGKIFGEAPLNIITVLRTLTVLENQLGSLGPKCVNLLSQALAMEKNKATSSVMLMHDENCVMFETIREKLRGQLMTGVVERHMVNATRHAIKSVEALLFHAPKIEKPSHLLDEGQEKSGIQYCDETVDKEVIAKQIAAALVAQGRPDVTNEELEVLIDAVISMSKAQKESSSETVDKKRVPSLSRTSEEEKPKKSEQKEQPSGLKLLQASYKNTEDSSKQEESLEQLSEQDIKDLLRNFKNLDKKEQFGLITYLSELEAKDPVKIKVYRKYLEIDDPESKKLAPSTSKKFDTPIETVKGSSPDSSRNNKKSKVSPFFVTATSGAEPISDDDDENYSIEDVYKVAAAKVEEKVKQEKPLEVEKPDAPLDVASMSATQASSILDWIKNNASESSDLFKNLLGNPNTSTSVSNMTEPVPPLTSGVVSDSATAVETPKTVDSQTPPFAPAVSVLSLSQPNNAPAPSALQVNSTHFQPPQDSRIPSNPIPPLEPSAGPPIQPGQVLPVPPGAVSFVPTGYVPDTMIPQFMPMYQPQMINSNPPTMMMMMGGHPAQPPLPPNPPMPSAAPPPPPPSEEHNQSEYQNSQQQDEYGNSSQQQQQQYINDEYREDSEQYYNEYQDNYGSDSESYHNSQYQDGYKGGRGQYHNNQYHNKRGGYNQHQRGARANWPFFPNRGNKF